MVRQEAFASEAGGGVNMRNTVTRALDSETHLSQWNSVDRIFPTTVQFSDGSVLYRRELSRTLDGVSLVFIDYVSKGEPYMYACFYDSWEHDLEKTWTPDFFQKQLVQAEDFCVRKVDSQSGGIL